MHRTIMDTIKKCNDCQKKKPLNYKPNGSIRIHKPKRILEKVSIDLMGSLLTGRGGTHYILVLVDRYIFKIYKAISTKEVDN